MNLILSSQTFLESLSCSLNDCYSWIIVLLNILSIFYLAFCAWFKITKGVKLLGWIWAAITLCATVLIIYMHTCIFTIISAVFTGLVLMAVLSVCFNNNNRDKESDTQSNDSKAIKGYYVIFNTDDNKYIYKLYDSSKKELMTSLYKYKDLDAVKKAVSECRKNAVDVYYEDATTNWVKDVDYPKIVLDEFNNKYFFSYCFSKEFTAMRSIKYTDVVLAMKLFKKSVDAVLTNEIYISKDIINGKDFEIYISKEVVKEVQTTTKEILPTGIVFKNDNRLTFDESLKKTPKPIKVIINDIIAYASVKDDVKEYSSKYIMKFKVKRYELLTIRFKKDKPVCSIMAGASEFKHLTVKENLPNIKESSISVVIENAESYETVKRLIDISYNNILEAQKIK